jgi:hypothetical protein
MVLVDYCLNVITIPFFRLRIEKEAVKQEQPAAYSKLQHAFLSRLDVTRQVLTLGTCLVIIRHVL